MDKAMLKIRLNRGWQTAVLNFKNIKLAYILPAALFAALIINIIVSVILKSAGIDTGYNSGIEINVFYAAVLLAAILIPAKNFKRCLTLNIKKKDYFLSALFNHAILSAAVSLLVVILFYALMRPLSSLNPELFLDLSLYRVFGWDTYGPVVGFLQQFGFLFFLSVFVHTLTSLQDKWLGWMLDCILIAIIPIFSAIPVLRQYGWGSIFYVLIFGHPAAQILFTLLGGTALFFVNILILKKKTV